MKPPHKPEPLPPAAPDADAWRAGIVSRSPEETVELGAAIARLLPPDTALALHGSLGAGKTAFTRGFAEALGVREAVTSPTFAIFNIYQIPARQLVHMDAYRLRSPMEADNLVLWDLLRSPWTLVVEWPENLGDRLPESAWHVYLEETGPEERKVRCEILSAPTLPKTATTATPLPARP
jgi:tRNA threonylcarbamoyladenosine biosynthesis protein TsaE